MWKYPLFNISHESPACLNQEYLGPRMAKPFPSVCLSHSANKGPSSQSYGFSYSHVWMRELDHKEN